MTNTEERIDQLFAEESTTATKEIFKDMPNTNTDISSSLSIKTDDDRINQLLDEDLISKDNNISNKLITQGKKSEISLSLSEKSAENKNNQSMNEESTSKSSKRSKSKSKKTKNESQKSESFSGNKEDPIDDKIDQLFNEESTTKTKKKSKKKANQKSGSSSSRSKKSIMNERIDQLFAEESTTEINENCKGESVEDDDQLKELECSSSRSKKSTKKKISELSNEESMTESKENSEIKSSKISGKQSKTEKSSSSRSKSKKERANQSSSQESATESSNTNRDQVYEATPGSENNSQNSSQKKAKSTKERLDQLFSQESATEIKRKSKVKPYVFVDLPKRPEVPSPYINRSTLLEKNNRNFTLSEFQIIRKVSSRKDILDSFQRIGKILNSVEPSSLPKEGLDKVCFILVNSVNNEYDYFGVGPFNDAYMIAKLFKQMGYKIALLYNPSAQKYLNFLEYFLTYTTTALTIYYTGKDAIANKDIDHGIYFIDNTIILQDDFSKFIFEKCHEKTKLFIFSDCSSGESVFNMDIVHMLIDETHKHCSEMVSFTVNKKKLKPRDRKLTHGLLTFYFCKFIKMYPNCSPKELVDMLNGAFLRFNIVFTDKNSESNLGIDIFFPDANVAFNGPQEISKKAVEEASQSESKNE